MEVPTLKQLVDFGLRSGTASRSMRLPSGMTANQWRERVDVGWQSDGWELDLTIDLDREGLFLDEIVPAGDLKLTWTKRGGEEPSTQRIQLNVGERREVELR